MKLSILFFLQIDHIKDHHNVQVPRGYSQCVRFWSINARKLLKQKAGIEARLANADVDLLFVQETWLSEAVEDIVIARYYLVERLDRATGPKHGFGGIDVFSITALTCVALLEYGGAHVLCLAHAHRCDTLGELVQAPGRRRFFNERVIG